MGHPVTFKKISATEKKPGGKKKLPQPLFPTFNSQLELVAVRLGGDRRGGAVRHQAHQRAAAGGTMADVCKQ